MKLYIYADESGTFDKEHNDLFVYGGLVVPGDSTKRDLERKYSAIENDIRRNASRFGEEDELKARYLRMRERKRLFALLQKSQCVQFGVVVDQKRLHDYVFAPKGSKQRYMDWALKMGVKKGVLGVVNRGIASKQDIDQIVVFVDEHSSSTEGKYNLGQSIDEEFRLGSGPLPRLAFGNAHTSRRHYRELDILCREGPPFVPICDAKRRVYHCALSSPVIMRRDWVYEAGRSSWRWRYRWVGASPPHGRRLLHSRVAESLPATIFRP